MESNRYCFVFYKSFKVGVTMRCGTFNQDSWSEETKRKVDEIVKTIKSSTKLVVRENNTNEGWDIINEGENIGTELEPSFHHIATFYDFGWLNRFRAAFEVEPGFQVASSIENTRE